MPSRYACQKKCVCEYIYVSVHIYIMATAQLIIMRRKLNTRFKLGRLRNMANGVHAFTVGE